jgi:sulfur carrier protein
MIKINDEKIEWRKDMTVKDAMDKVRYSFPLVIVSVNGNPVPMDDIGKYKIKDGDEIKVFHLISGG